MKNRRTHIFFSRPIKSYWHGAGQVWGVSDLSSVSPPGSCDEWRSVIMVVMMMMMMMMMMMSSFVGPFMLKI